MRGKRVTWSDYLIMPVRVLIGRGPPCPPYVIGHATRTPPSIFHIFIPTSSSTHYFFKNSCRSLFLLPPSFAYFHIRLSQITTISARQTFGQPFLSKYNFVIHYELVQKHWVFARFCSLEYIHTRKSHLLQVNQREKLGAIVLHVLSICSISSLSWTGIRAGLLTWEVSVATFFNDWSHREVHRSKARGLPDRQRKFIPLSALIPCDSGVLADDLSANPFLKHLRQRRNGRLPSLNSVPLDICVSRLISSPNGLVLGGILAGQISYAIAIRGSRP